MPEVKTKGGIMLPEKSMGKIAEATVVAVGPGAKGDVSSVPFLLFKQQPSSNIIKGERDGIVMIPYGYSSPVVMLVHW